jgi:hypothetical protein
MKRSFLPVLVATLALITLPGIAMAQIDQLVQRVPSSANALVLINVDKIMSSPVAQAESWEADRSKRFNAGLTNIPPNADQLVLASQLNLSSMRPIWEAALVRADAAPPLQTLAKDLGGTIDEVAGFPAICLSDDSYVVKLSDNVMGAIAPANRQLAARWVRETGGNLSPYLQKALSYVEGSAGVVMALDLTDALTVSDVESRIQNSASDILKNASIDKTELANILASINGVVLGVTFTDQVSGKILVDFGRDATLLTPIAKPMLLHILGERGAMIDEFANWDVSVTGTRITLEGKLTDSGLTRLSSMVELPTQTLTQEKKPQTTAQASPGDSSSAALDAAQATQQYFKSVNHLLSDLKVQKKEARTMGQIGQWYDNYAHKIDQLPLLHVDDDMLKYGDFVASQLRDASMAIKGVGIRTRVGEVNAVASGVTNSYYGGGGFGNYGYAGYGYFGGSWTRGMTRNEQASARTQVRANETATGAASVQQILEQIEDASAKIRKAMTQKYQVEF